jgi:hypothetical protein
VQKDGEENQPAQPVRNQKSRSDGDTVEEGVNNQSEQHRIARVRVHELVAMRFFAEVEMRRDRMFEEMNDQISQQHKKGRGPSAQFEAFRDHLDERRGQHESRAQRHKVTEVAPLPVPLHNDRSAEDVGGGGGQTEEDAGCDWVHLLSTKYLVLSTEPNPYGFISFRELMRPLKTRPTSSARFKMSAAWDSDR